MRKTIVVLVLLLVFASVFASDVDTYCFNCLTAPEQIAYLAIKDCLTHLIPSWNCGSMTQEAIRRAYESLLMDHPEYYWAESYTYVTSYVNNTITGHRVEFSYNMGASQIKRTNDEITEALYAMVAEMNAADSSEYSTVRAVFDYIVDNCSYDELNLDQSLYSVMVNRSGVCASFSKAFEFIMQCLEIPCTVVYGLPGHKVHSKLCVITRQKEGRICHITQVGTGNYNEVTGEQYTDLSLITAREDVGLEAKEAFEALEKGEIPPEAHALWIAPLSFKPRVLEMLDRELAKGENGRVAIKANAINNREVMEKLIECSQAGVKIELFIRGICSLRPGVTGLTENITVKGVIGRWLEHSRIYSFGEGKDQRLFIGSGDLLNRNLERRVEAFVEAVTPDTREQLNEILEALRNDREKSWRMLPDGTYVREEGGEGTSSQEALYRYFSTRKVSLTEPEPEPPKKPEVPELPQAQAEVPAEQKRTKRSWFRRMFG